MVSRLEDIELSDFTTEGIGGSVMVDPEKLQVTLNAIVEKLNETLEARANIWDRLRDALSDAATSTT